MKKSVTVVFALLFLLVLGVYLYLENETQETKIQEVAIQQEEMQLLSLPEGDRITYLKIQKAAGGEKIILSCEGGESWRIEYPVSYPADAMIASGLVTALTMSYKVQKLKPEKGWEEYGLKEPSLKISLRTQKNAKERSLSFGENSPIGNFVYARWDEEKEFFLVSEELNDAFQQSLYTLRDKSVFHADSKQVSKIHLKLNDGEYELTKNKDKWFWMEPIPILGEFISDADREPILEAVQNLRVKEFIDQPFLDEAKFGFGASNRFVTIWQDDKEQTLEIGSEAEIKEAFYTRREKQESPYLISSSKLNALFETVKAATDKALAKAALSGSGMVDADKFEKEQPSLVSAPAPKGTTSVSVFSAPKG
ncbi:MAG: DUF4340 domain-containing protein [Candidatus Omnitrophica bacterium]|nr:DUF4340 domain-containing protein [Candidatus Omnitrophota bacterium]